MNLVHELTHNYPSFKKNEVQLEVDCKQFLQRNFRRLICRFIRRLIRRFERLPIF